MEPEGIIALRPHVGAKKHIDGGCDDDLKMIYDEFTPLPLAGGSLRTSTRPMLNLLLLLSASVQAFTIHVSHAPILVRVLVRNDPAA